MRNEQYQPVAAVWEITIGCNADKGIVMIQ